MSKLLVLTLTFLSLPNMKCQAPPPASIASTQEFPCINITERIIPPRDMRFWTLNQSYHVIRLSIIPQDCEYLYIVTNISIQIRGNNDVDIDDYNISYRLNDNITTAPLRELEVLTLPVGMNGRKLINIAPMLIEEMWISKNISDGNIEVRYTLGGYSTRRLRVLSYEIADTNRMRTDDTYTGVCNGRVCYGGKGQLMDGFIGSENDTFRSDSNVMWRCNTQGGCIFPLKIKLTGCGLVSHIKLYGFDPRQSNVIPEVELIQPNILTNSIRNSSSSATYSIEIPINTVTDEIYLNMTIKGMRNLVLSEVEVISDGVNIALFSLKTCQCNNSSNYLSTIPSSGTSSGQSHNLCHTNLIIKILLPLIIGVSVLMNIILVIICMYVSIKYRNAKHKLDVVNLSILSSNTSHGRIHSKNELRYSHRTHDPNAVYATILPECLTQIPLPEIPKSDNKLDSSEIISNNYVESQETSKIPKESHKDEDIPGIDTIETPLQSPTKSCDSNCQDINQARYIENAFVEDGEKTESKRNDLHNESLEYEMKDNPLYPNVDIKPQEYDHLNLVNGNLQFSGYDALKH